MWYIDTHTHTHTHTHKGMLFSFEKKEIFCNSMDEPGVNCAKWSKGDTKNQVSRGLIYIWNIKKKKVHVPSNKEKNGGYQMFQWGKKRDIIKGYRF